MNRSCGSPTIAVGRWSELTDEKIAAIPLLTPLRP
jgi:hypothetical protein